jgi:hypothetical protein
MLSVVIDVSPHGCCDKLGTALNLMRNEPKFEQAICHGTFFFIKADRLS